MNLPPGCRLSIEKNPSRQDREFIDEALGDYNAPFLTDHRYDYFGLFVRDDGGFDGKEAPSLLPRES